MKVLQVFDECYDIGLAARQITLQGCTPNKHSLIMNVEIKVIDIALKA